MVWGKGASTMPKRARLYPPEFRQRIVELFAGRRTRLTLPNGVSTEYTYDAASRLTGLTYKHGAMVVGTLAYSYDAAGKRTQTTGTWARTAVATRRRARMEVPAQERRPPVVRAVLQEPVALQPPNLLLETFSRGSKGPSSVRPCRKVRLAGMIFVINRCPRSRAVPRGICPVTGRY
jgi:YD repeat-containing protein